MIIMIMMMMMIARLYMWSLEEGELQEHDMILLPTTPSIQLPKMNIKQRLKY